MKTFSQVATKSQLVSKESFCSRHHNGAELDSRRSDDRYFANRCIVAQVASPVAAVRTGLPLRHHHHRLEEGELDKLDRSVSLKGRLPFDWKSPHVISVFEGLGSNLVLE